MTFHTSIKGHFPYTYNREGEAIMHAYRVSCLIWPITKRVRSKLGKIYQSNKRIHFTYLSDIPQPAS
jgi:hypothetical protein